MLRVTDEDGFVDPISGDPIILDGFDASHSVSWTPSLALSGNTASRSSLADAAAADVALRLGVGQWLLPDAIGRAAVLVRVFRRVAAVLAKDIEVGGYEL